MQKLYNFLPKNVSNFCSAKVPNKVSAKIIITADFVATVRHDKSSANDFVKLTVL